MSFHLGYVNKVLKLNEGTRKTLSCSMQLINNLNSE